STYKRSYSAAVDGFISVVNNDGKYFLNSTYIGTSAYDQAFFIQLDEDENVYVYGQTAGNFPVKNTLYSNPKSGQFITKFNNGLDSILVSSVFGSGRTQPDISPTAFLVDNCGKIYISGWGGGTNISPLGHGGSTKNMALTPDAFQKTTDTSDFYLAVFAANMDTILYGSYFGGNIAEEHVDGGTSRFDKKGVIYQSVCGGCGGFSDFPVTDSAWSQTNESSNCNNLVFKVNLETPDIIVAFDTVKPNCEPYTVTFKNKSIRARSYVWDFGDGDTSHAYNPTHTYDTAGTYTVRLIGTNFFSCSVHDTFFKKVTVIKNSDSKFTVTPKPCSNEVSYEAKGFGTDFRWDFGDSTFTAGRKVTHKYLTPGKYTVKLFADSATLCGTNSSQQVSVNFTTSLFRERYDTCQPIVYFTNYSVNAKTSLWIFSDGTTDTARNAVHEFKTPGLYDAMLVTFDSTGCSDTSGVFINIAGEPKASFNVIPDPCKHRISFKNTSILASKHIWDFGDGKTSTAKDVIHEYMQPGTYTVKLTINPNSKCPRSFTQTIKITFPTAGFTHSFEECKPLVNFYNKSIFSHKYIWDFGDGATDTSKNPKHFYTTPGNYFVKMYAIDSAGCRDSAFVSLQIGDTAAAAFTIINDTCSGLVYFQNNSKMADTYLWKFGDGTTDTSKNPVHNYAVKDKEYTVTLIINYHPDGCIDSITQKVTPYSPPRASFSYLKDSCTSIVEFTSETFRAHTYFWDFGDGLTSTEKNPKHPYTGKGKFNIKFIINPFTACADTAENNVFMPRGELSKPEIYNVITPNGDDLNDVFHIENLSQCHFYELEIYNRWGQIIYENNGNKMFWDGTTMKGKAVAEGVYFYIFRDPIFGQQHGTITVVR
ncbi:MAG: PKD domain-containing protein, partial [Bacteroidia bacterium]